MNDGKELNKSLNDIYAYQSMAFDIVENLLKFVKKPEEMNDFISDFLREMTGARIIVIHELNIHNQLEMAYVNPPRKIDIVNSGAVAGLAYYVSIEKRSFRWNCGIEDKTADPLLAELGICIAMGFPLIYGDEYVGSILLLDLPTHERTELAHNAIKMVSSIVALAIKNSRQFENQEKIIEERTRDINESRKRLNALINNLPGLVYRSNVGKFLSRQFVSNDYLEFLGIEVKEDKPSGDGVDLKEIIHPDDIKWIENSVKQALKNNSDIELTYRIITCSG